MLVRVVDSTGTPIPGADVTVLVGLRDSIGNGSADENGRRRFTVPGRPIEYHVTARRIGYKPTDQFVPPQRGDQFVDVIMADNPESLAAVQVVAKEDQHRKSYHLEADDIANSDEPVYDAADVISKLRPDMITGRMGHPDRLGQHVGTGGARRSAPTGRPAYVGGGCSGINTVFVNGKRIPFGPVNASARSHQPRNMTEVPSTIIDILTSIRPEHILEMNYVDCLSNATDRASAQNSVFIVLKPGVEYVQGVGSRVVPDDRKASRD